MSNKLFNVAPPSAAAALYHDANTDKKDDKKEAFLDTTMGKVSLGLAGAALGAGAVYLYNKSQSDK